MNEFSNYWLNKKKEKAGPDSPLTPAIYEQLKKEVRQEFEKEFDSKLEEAYEQLSAELKGYEEKHAKEMSTVREEYEQANRWGQEAYQLGKSDGRKESEKELQENEKIALQGYEEAYQLLLVERKAKDDAIQELLEYKESSTDSENSAGWRKYHQERESNSLLQSSFDTFRTNANEELNRLTTQVRSLEAKLVAVLTPASARENIPESSCKSLGELELKLYEEYEQKLHDMREYIVDKVDQFLKFKANEGDEDETTQMAVARIRKTMTPRQIVEKAIST